ncbi:MAG: lytic murein transglycosylase B [Steroidobacteraceae bacterium]
MPKLSNTLGILLLALLPGTALADSRAEDRNRFDLTRKDIQSFVADFATTQKRDADAVWKLLAQAEPQPRIIEAMSKPAEKALPWWQYRARFLTPERIEQGAQLWRAHRELLDQVAAERHVEPEYLIAILGVETSYGRITGRYRVLDALSTLAFDYPARSEFFRKELAQYLLLVEDEKLDATATLGSYAGAMGAAQFMPSSYRNFAVNEGSSTQRDLWNDWGDIFASIANYFSQHGWQYGGPVLAEATLAADRSLDAPSTVALDRTLKDLAGAGLTVSTSLPADTQAVLISAPREDAQAWRVGFKNFYVITRYNRSPMYAMAVYELAAAVKQRVLEDANR